jgi:hypothetical protein
VTRLERTVNIAAVVIPFLGLIVGATLLWHGFLDARDVAIFALMYALTAVGVTVGFHRLLTHRAFRNAGVAALHACGAGVDVAAGTCDRLGRRPSQASYVHRRRGCPAQPTRGRRGGVPGDRQGALARAHRLAV